MPTEPCVPMFRAQIGVCSIKIKCFYSTYQNRYPEKEDFCSNSQCLPDLKPFCLHFVELIMGEFIINLLFIILLPHQLICILVHFYLPCMVFCIATIHQVALCLTPCLQHSLYPEREKKILIQAFMPDYCTSHRQVASKKYLFTLLEPGAFYMEHANIWHFCFKGD